MSQIEHRLDFSNDRYSKNEFKAGDFIKFGRITFHVRETSEDPIVLSEASQVQDITPMNRSYMDNTNANMEHAFGTQTMDPTLTATLRFGGQYLDPNRVNSDNSPRSPSFLRAPESLQRVQKRVSTSSLSPRSGGNSNSDRERKEEAKSEEKGTF